MVTVDESETEEGGARDAALMEVPGLKGVMAERRSPASERHGDGRHSRQRRDGGAQGPAPGRGEVHDRSFSHPASPYRRGPSGSSRAGDSSLQNVEAAAGAADAVERSFEQQRLTSPMRRAAERNPEEMLHAAMQAKLGGRADAAVDELTALCEVRTHTGGHPFSPLCVSPPTAVPRPVPQRLLDEQRVLKERLAAGSNQEPRGRRRAGPNARGRGRDTEDEEKQPSGQRPLASAGIGVVRSGAPRATRRARGASSAASNDEEYEEGGAWAGRLDAPRTAGGERDTLSLRRRRALRGGGEAGAGPAQESAGPGRRQGPAVAFGRKAEAGNDASGRARRQRKGSAPAARGRRATGSSADEGGDEEEVGASGRKRRNAAQRSALEQRLQGLTPAQRRAKVRKEYTERSRRASIAKRAAQRPPRQTPRAGARQGQEQGEEKGQRRGREGDGRAGGPRPAARDYSDYSDYGGYVGYGAGVGAGAESGRSERSGVSTSPLQQDARAPQAAQGKELELASPTRGFGPALGGVSMLIFPGGGDQQGGGSGGGDRAPPPSQAHNGAGALDGPAVGSFDELDQLLDAQAARYRARDALVRGPIPSE